MTYLDYRYRVEFGAEQYTEIAAYAAARGPALVRLPVGRAVRGVPGGPDVR